MFLLELHGVCWCAMCSVGSRVRGVPYVLLKPCLRGVPMFLLKPCVRGVPMFAMSCVRGMSCVWLLSPCVRGVSCTLLWPCVRCQPVVECVVRSCVVCMGFVSVSVWVGRVHGLSARLPCSLSGCLWMLVCSCSYCCCVGPMCP